MADVTKKCKALPMTYWFLYNTVPYLYDILLGLKFRVGNKGI